MNELMIKTPGVYINEVNAFPNAVVPVESAVPAFIGYTPQASYEGKSYLNKPTIVTSMAEFQAIFCYPNPAPPASPAKQYSPEYYLVKQKSKPEKGEYMVIDNSYYSIVPDPYTIYYLYNSVRIFYENGGGDCYIVSVGSYGEPSKKPMNPGDQIINPNVQLNDLLGGLALLQNEQEPTMYICPEATLLSVADNANLMQEMLLQNSNMQTAISIFDVIGGNDPDPILYTNDITAFRNSTGDKDLKYGAAYYPFIGTSLMQPTDIDYTNINGGDLKQLSPILNPPSNPNQSVATILSNIENPPGKPLTPAQYSSALTIASQDYGNIIKHILSQANILPPSGAMAGVIANIDGQIGPWQAPANTSIVGVSSIPINLSDKQQENLNVDAISGKSINAIRNFNGPGILIWGARTLDGNSGDWKYLSVRRTLTWIEQSCKIAARAYVFEPNDANTWSAVKSMIGSFLNGVWKEGGLMGATASAAYQVECGLGSTMTADDVTNGFLKVSVKLAMTKPAEFIVLTFEQEQATSG